MPRLRSDSLNLLPSGVRYTSRASTYQLYVSLLGRHTRNGEPRYVGSWRDLDELFVVRDSVLFWLRFAGDPEAGFHHTCLGFSDQDPVPFLVQAADFGRRCILALGTTTGLEVPESLPGLRAFALGRLPKPIRLF